MLHVEIITLCIVAFLAIAAVVRGVQTRQLYAYLQEMKNKAHQHKRVVDTIKKNVRNAKLKGIAKKDASAKAKKAKKTDVTIKTG